VREYGEKWNRYLDVPPMRWFKEPLTEGALKGAMLDLEQYDVMLDAYYEKRGWSHNGVPKKETMERLGLMEAAKQLHPKPLV
jgi:aldehyde:ferredoxin oxidoreductase